MGVCAAAAARRPVIVDLCTGSGALAARPGAALARRPRHRRRRLRRRAGLRPPQRRGHRGRTASQADVTDPGLLAELDGQVDLVVANPPYIPDGAALEPEVADMIRRTRCSAARTGWRSSRAIVELAGRWLRPGGLLAVEHDDTTSRRHRRTSFSRGRAVSTTSTARIATWPAGPGSSPPRPRAGRGCAGER